MPWRPKPAPAMGAGVFQEFPKRGSISNAGIGRDGMAPRVRYGHGLEMCKMVNVSCGGMPLRGTAGAEEFRKGV